MIHKYIYIGSYDMFTFDIVSLCAFLPALQCESIGENDVKSLI